MMMMMMVLLVVVVVVVMMSQARNGPWNYLGSELFQAHNQMCILQLAIIWMFFLAITPVIAPDYSSTGLHYNLKEHATRDAILGQKIDIINFHSPKRNRNRKMPQQKQMLSASMGPEKKTQRTPQNL